MSQVIIIAVWDVGEDVMTRPVDVGEVKELKFKGRKPNKMIVPESVVDHKVLKKIKKLGSYNCKIVKAIGK